MRILVISDIHANLPALEAVLNHAGTVDETWCLGDVIGYGPDANECIERVRNLPAFTCLMGNHDAAALGQVDLRTFNNEARLSLQIMRRILKEENMDYLRSLPLTSTIGEATMAHGSPRNPVWEYILDTVTAQENFAHFKGPFCIVGHTHVPVAFSIAKDSRNLSWKLIQSGQKISLNNGRTILNPGSVGQPRDHDPRAAYAILDTEARSWESQRVEYDFSGVQERIEKLGLPERHARRLADGW
jgi:diadenosine tetraphosphatase ApaH/serine/threonine PP2A family protein phosphatase